MFEIDTKNAFLAVVLFLLPGLLFATDTSESDDSSEFIESEIAVIYTHETLTDMTGKKDVLDRERNIELEIETEFSLYPTLEGFLSFSFIAEQVREPEQSVWQKNEFAALNEIWLKWEPEHDFAPTFRLGRQEFEDSRSWWWSEELDALRLQKELENITLSMALAKLRPTVTSKNDRIDPEEQSLYWFLANTHTTLPDSAVLDLFFVRREDHSSIYQDDQLIKENEADEADAKINWLGLRYSQDFRTNRLGRYSFAMDLALMKGNEKQVIYKENEEDESEEELSDADESDTAAAEIAEIEDLIVDHTERRSLAGWALDVSLAWQPKFFNNTNMELRYATGSGTSRKQSPGSHTFRQNGLHSNDTPISYYGSLYNPDLSNIRILSLAVSFATGNKGLLTLLYNDYRKRYGFDAIAQVGIDHETVAGREQLGHETGLAYRYGLDEDLSIEVELSQFKAGRAYGAISGEVFHRIDFEIKYSF